MLLTHTAVNRKSNIFSKIGPTAPILRSIFPFWDGFAASAGDCPDSCEYLLRSLCLVVTFKVLSQCSMTDGTKLDAPDRNDPQGPRQTPGTDQGNRFGGTEQLAVRPSHSAAHQGPHFCCRPGTELPSQFLCPNAAQEANLHRRRALRRNRRCLRQRGDQRHRRSAQRTEILLRHGGASSQRTDAAAVLRHSEEPRLGRIHHH